MKPESEKTSGRSSLCFSHLLHVAAIVSAAVVFFAFVPRPFKREMRSSVTID